MATVVANYTGGNSADGLNQEVINSTAIQGTGINVPAGTTHLIGMMSWGAGATPAPTALAMTWGGSSMIQQIAASLTSSGSFAESVLFSISTPSTGANVLKGSWATARDCYMSAIAFSGTNNVSTVASSVATSSLSIASATGDVTIAVFASNGGTTTINNTIIFNDAPNSPSGGANYALDGTNNVHSFGGGGPTVSAISALRLQGTTTAAGGFIYSFNQFQTLGVM